MTWDSKLFFIGDRVMTQWGEAYVESCRTWRDEIEDMEEVEAVEFSSRCKRECGNDFREKWNRITVSIKDMEGIKKLYTTTSDNISVIRGRADENDIFAKKKGA